MRVNSLPPFLGPWSSHFLAKPSLKMRFRSDMLSLRNESDNLRRGFIRFSAGHFEFERLCARGFAIASGVSPQQGLWTAIIAGALVSALGGSRFQIAGPTGAFVPVLAAIVAAHGYGGLAIATMMAGAMLFLMGALRLGGLIK